VCLLRGIRFLCSLHVYVYSDGYEPAVFMSCYIVKFHVQRNKHGCHSQHNCIICTVLLLSDDLYPYLRRYFRSTDVTLCSVSIKNATMKALGTTVSYCVWLTVRTPANWVKRVAVCAVPPDTIHCNTFNIYGLYSWLNVVTRNIKTH